MSLTQKYTSPLFLPFNPKKIHPSPKPFEETLIRRLNALLNSLPQSSPSVPLSFLIHAVNLLSSTLASASALLSDPNLSRPGPDVPAFSSHLDASVSLLDSINLISSHADRISRLRLHVRFALHLLSSSPDLTRKARDSLAEWAENLHKPPLHFSAGDLVRSEPPRGKASAVRRAIYAVEAVSALVIGTVLSFLGAKADLEKIRVSGEFHWSEAFNGVLTAVSKKVGGFAAEIEAVDSRVKRLAAVVDDGDVTEGLRSLTEEAEKGTEQLTEGLDRLGSAVNGLFRAALSTRDVVLQGFRIGAQKCK